MSITKIAMHFALKRPDILSYDRYLFFGPHPDDIEIGAGATIAKLSALGKKIRFVICTDGRYGSDVIEPDELIKIRREEAVASAGKLGVCDIVFLNLSDGAFYKEEELLGHNIVLVSNLKPANFRGVKSRGMLLAASDPTAEDPHSTCEVIFCDDIEPGTVLKAEDEKDVEKVTTYIKPDHFFAIPLKTVDGYVTVEGKKIGYDGKFLRVSKYVNGNVG